MMQQSKPDGGVGAASRGAVVVALSAEDKDTLLRCAVLGNGASLRRCSGPDAASLVHLAAAKSDGGGARDDSDASDDKSQHPQVSVGWAFSARDDGSSFERCAGRLCTKFMYGERLADSSSTTERLGPSRAAILNWLRFDVAREKVLVWVGHTAVASGVQALDLNVPNTHDRHVALDDLVAVGSRSAHTRALTLVLCAVLDSTRLERWLEEVRSSDAHQVLDVRVRHFGSAIRTVSATRDVLTGRIAQAVCERFYNDRARRCGDRRVVDLAKELQAAGDDGAKALERLLSEARQPAMPAAMQDQERRAEMAVTLHETAARGNGALLGCEPREVARRFRRLSADTCHFPGLLPKVDEVGVCELRAERSGRVRWRSKTSIRFESTGTWEEAVSAAAATLVLDAIRHLW